MTFKQFITRQRVSILIIGIILSAITLSLGRRFGIASVWGALLIDLAASSITIVLTALIIDYLGAREEASKISDAATLAEEEIRSICARIEWQIAQLFGLERNRAERLTISNHDEARTYLQKNYKRVQSFIASLDFDNNKELRTDEAALSRYSDRLQRIQAQLEQTLVLYEYALSHDFRVRALELRQELQITERLLGFIEFGDEVTDENESLIRLTAAAVYEAAQALL